MSRFESPTNDPGIKETKRLADIVMTSGSAEDRNRAMAELHPVIRRLAEIATRGLKPENWRQELIDEAASVVWEKLRVGAYDTAKGPFEAWCRTVLRNWRVDQVRCQKRRSDLLRGAQTLDPERGIDPPDPRATSETVLERTEPFGAADLKMLEGLPALDRVVFLCLSDNLWLHVSSTTWKQWLDACDLDEPFPPEGFASLGSQSGRYAALASALNKSRNALSQRFRRSKQRLVEHAALTSGKEVNS